LAVAVGGSIAEHLGGSLEADSAATGVNYDWMQEYAAQASGLGATFRPTIIGFAAVLDNLSSFLDNARQPIAISAAAGAYIVLWLFLTGGMIDRYARDRKTHASGFFASCGVFFFRFVRLGVVMWIVYAFLFGFVHPWLFTSVYGKLTANVTVERSAFFIRVALYVLFGLVLGGFNLLFDYAKVRAVVEDRRSMTGALAAAAQFIRHNRAASVTLYVLNFALFAVAIGLYAAIAPSAGGSGWLVWAALAIGQLYILARLAVKLVFWSSETALFQGRLAHARYVARPEKAWPESPEVEAITIEELRS